MPANPRNPNDPLIGCCIDIYRKELRIANGLKLVSGGTDNHLLLIDLNDSALTGQELEERLDKAHITANKNTIPGDKRSPRITSGVRLGTPAVTTRGFKEEEMKQGAKAIALVAEDENNIPKAQEIIALLTTKYPLI